MNFRPFVSEHTIGYNGKMRDLHGKMLRDLQTGEEIGIISDSRVVGREFATETYVKVGGADYISVGTDTEYYIGTRYNV